MPRWNNPNCGFQKGHPVFGGYENRFKKRQIPWNKNKFIQTNTGRTHFQKGHIPWIKGKKLNYIPSGIWKKGMPQELHPRWKGGISKDHTKYMRKYRQKKGKRWVQSCNNQRRDLTFGLTLKVVQVVYEENIKNFGTLTCIYCLNPIQFGNDSLEHKQPLSRGGTNEKNNLAVACKKCNNKKNKKTEEEYRKEIFTNGR